MQAGLKNTAPWWTIPAHSCPPSIFHVQKKRPWRYSPLSWYAIKCHSDARNSTFVYVTTKIWANAGKYNWSQARGICTLFSRHWQTSKIISQNKMLEQKSSVTEQCSSRFKNTSHLQYHSTGISVTGCQVELSSGFAMERHHRTFWPKQSAVQVLQDMEYLWSCTEANNHRKYSNYLINLILRPWKKKKNPPNVFKEWLPNVFWLLDALQSFCLDTLIHSAKIKRGKIPNCINTYFFSFPFFIYPLTNLQRMDRFYFIQLPLKAMELQQLNQCTFLSLRLRR